MQWTMEKSIPEHLVETTLYDAPLSSWKHKPRVSVVAPPSSFWSWSSRFSSTARDVLLSQITGLCTLGHSGESWTVMISLNPVGFCCYSLSSDKFLIQLQINCYIVHSMSSNTMIFIYRTLYILSMLYVVCPTIQIKFDSVPLLLFTEL